MSRTRALHCLCVVAFFGALVALVLALRDHQAEGERRPLAPYEIDDDGAADLPLLASPPDAYLPGAAALLAPPDPDVTSQLDGWVAARPLEPVIVNPTLAEPEAAPAPVPTMSGTSGGLGDAATGVVLASFAAVRIRRARRRIATVPGRRAPEAAGRSTRSVDLQMS